MPRTTGKPLRRTGVSLAAAGALLAATAVSAPAATALPQVAWKQTWASEFNGKGGIPPEWLPVTGNGTNGWSHRALQFYKKENVAQDGKGNLVITANQTPLWNWVTGKADKCWNGTCMYTSGRVQTSGKFSQAYGRFSARIKIPTGNGMWPAFWMQRDKPPYGEIDIVETIGRLPNTVQGYAHGGDRSGGGVRHLPQPLSAGYHVYGVDWTPDKIVWWVDGRPFGEMKRDKGWVFDGPMYMILTLGVGGDFPGDPWFTAFPQRMEVDWIRVYKA